MYDVAEDLQRPGWSETFAAPYSVRDLAEC